MSNGNGSSLESEKYHVIRELGRGGMGVVYLAEDRQLRRKVALKVLYDYLNRDRDFVERFQEEACSVSTLHHSNIVCVHGLERAGDVVAIDMEFVEGASLDQFTTVSPHVAAGIARDVLGGLAACHHIGVVHRDIKPSNILMNKSGQAKITDFGLATAYATHMEATMQGVSSSGFYMGTPRYMPMQAWEGANPEPFWDLYSFGVVLHELLSGKPAFKGDNPIAVMRKQLAESLPPLHTVSSQISPELSDLVETLLNSSRAESGITCADAFDLLRESPEFKALQESDSSPTLPALPRFRRRANRTPGDRRVIIFGASAIALLVAAAASIYSATRPGAPEDATARPAPAAPEQLAASPPSLPSGMAFYDAEVIDAPDEEKAVWMVEFNESGKPRHITGVSRRSLWSMDVVDSGQGSKLQVTGHWGSRLSDTSASSEYGNLDGTLLWDLNADHLVLSLARHRGNDRERISMTIACRRKPASFGKSEFYRAIEANGVVSYLLYRELLLKRLPWAVALEARLPALEGARAIVPQAAELITIDGKLDEPTWKDGAFDPAAGLVGELQAGQNDSRHRMLVRWGVDAVYIALDAPGVAADGLELGIAPMIELNPMHSGRFIVSVNPAGDLTGMYFLGDTRQAWPCDWEIRLRNEGGATRAEVKIPINLLKSSAAPVDGKRWRVNARLTSSAASEAGKSLPHWGDGDLKALEHGALLVFKESKDSVE